MRLHFDPMATDEKLTALSRAGETPAEGLRFSIEEARRTSRVSGVMPRGESVLSALPILDPGRSWLEAGFDSTGAPEALLHFTDADAPAPTQG